MSLDRRSFASLLVAAVFFCNLQPNYGEEVNKSAEPEAEAVCKQLMEHDLTLRADSRQPTHSFSFDLTFAYTDDHKEFKSIRHEVSCVRGISICVVRLSDDSPYCYLSPGELIWAKDPGKLTVAYGGFDIYFDANQLYILKVGGAGGATVELDMKSFLQDDISEASAVTFDRGNRLLQFKSERRITTYRISRRTDMHAFPIESMVRTYTADPTKVFSFANIVRGALSPCPMFPTTIADTLRDPNAAEVINLNEEIANKLCDVYHMDAPREPTPSARRLLGVLPAERLASENEKREWDEVVKAIGPDSSAESWEKAEAALVTLSNPGVRAASRLDIATPEKWELDIQYRRAVAASILERRFGFEQFRSFQKAAIARLLDASASNLELGHVATLLARIGVTENSDEYRRLAGARPNSTMKAQRKAVAFVRAHLGCVTDDDVQVLKQAAMEELLADNDPSWWLCGLALVDDLKGFKQAFKESLVKALEKPELKALLMAAAYSETGQSILVGMANGHRRDEHLAQILRHLAANVDRKDAQCESVIQLAEQVALDEQESVEARFFATLLMGNCENQRPGKLAVVRRALRGDNPELLISLREVLVSSPMLSELLPEFRQLLDAADPAVRRTAADLFATSTPRANPISRREEWLALVRKMFDDPDAEVRGSAADALFVQRDWDLPMDDFLPDVVRAIRETENYEALTRYTSLVAAAKKVKQREVLAGNSRPGFTSEMYNSEWVRENRNAIADRAEKLVNSGKQ